MAVADPVPAHWIRPNHVTRIPRRHVIIDTEAVETEGRGVKVQTFRLGCGAFDHQTKAGRDWRPTERARFTTPEQLWEWVDSCTLAGRRTIVVAHNLGYDLRVARAFELLPALGWTLEMVRLDGGAAWCQWKRDGRSLSMVDTVSWFGVGLDKVAALVGAGKAPLPEQDDPVAAWWLRCELDVEILRVAWRRVLSWIETGDLGNWKPTGAGQGWAFFRHRHMTHKILHHAHAGIAAIEREAAYTGRCEAWRWGKLPRGQWTEYDFVSAYAQVCEDDPVPTRLLGHLGPKGSQRAVEAPERVCAVIRATVATDTPTLPYRASSGILWPVGQMSGWWWNHELAMAAAAGAQITAHEGWHYQTEPAMRSWAGWVLDALDATPADLDPLLRLIVKQWSRTTVGRFGAQWSAWEDIGEGHGGDVALYQAEHGATGRKWRLMMVGGRCLSETDRADAPDGAPQVMSYVMAACRVRVWRAMTVAGLDNIGYVDTDGVIVNDQGAARLDAAGLPGLRPKAKWRSVEVLGPRQLILRGELRAAGVPKNAQRTGPRTWTADVWRSLPASLRQGELDRVVLTQRKFALRGVDHRRAHVEGGLTVPFEVGP